MINAIISNSKKVKKSTELFVYCQHSSRFGSLESCQIYLNDRSHEIDQLVHDSPQGYKRNAVDHSHLSNRSLHGIHRDTILQMVHVATTYGTNDSHRYRYEVSRNTLAQDPKE
jgi:hypothetical protein